MPLPKGTAIASGRRGGVIRVGEGETFQSRPGDLPSQTRRGGGGGGSGSNNQQEQFYSSELLNQSFTSLEAKQQAEAQYYQQQTISKARTEDIAKQRASITSRGSAIVQVGKDTPQSYQEAGITSSVSKAQSVPARQVVRELVDQPSKIIPTIKGAVSRFLKTDEKKARTEKEFQKQVTSKEGLQPTIDTSIPVQQGSNVGTSQQLVYRSIPTEQLLKEASFGNQVALGAAAKRAEKEINTRATNIASVELSIDKQKLNDYANTLQNRINTGDISAKQAEKDLKNYATALDKDRQSRIESQLAPTIEVTQQKLDRAATRGKISNIAINTAIALATAPLIVEGAALLPKAAQTGIALATGTGIGFAGVKLGKNLVQGKAGALDVVGFTLPLVAFGVGAKVYSKVRGVDPIKVQEAIDSARIELKSNPQILTTETQIKALKLSNQNEIELISRIRKGERVAVERYEIKNVNLEKQNLIERAIPQREILKVGNINVRGEIINGEALVRIRSGKGFNIKQEFQIEKTQGRILDGETGIALTDTLALRVKNGQLLESTKTRTVTKPQLKDIRDTQGNLLGRVVKTDSYSFQGTNIKATKERPLRIEEKAFTGFEEYKNIPSSKSQQVELQKFIGGELEYFPVNAGEVIVKTNKRFATTQAQGYSERIGKPIEFNKVPSKIYKEVGIKEIVNKPKDIKFTKEQAIDITKTLRSIYGDQVQKQSAKVDSTYDNLISSISPQQTQKAFKEQALEVNKVRVKSVKLNSQVSNLDKQILNLNTKTSQVNLPSLKQQRKTLTRQVVPLAFNTKQLDKQIQSLSIGQGQFQPQGQQIGLKSMQRQAQPQGSGFGKPFVPFTPNFPRPFSFPLGSNDFGGIRKEPKKLKRRSFKSSSKYTADLASAIFQASPTKVTRKQYEALNKATFSGLERRPVLQIIDDNLNRSAKTSVKF